ncbi:cyclin-dependent protein kinase inhibitor SMR11 [Argentina anserina]|uniref:cyclin-dependent protein kinase inhibitor SMR11 n=1 Tax=Argentina anserina TaxID=57926 RepID=UPI0021767D89|nr:cyclin-dependent protein kinase inhibitor SMR11 [Potentilla anserina]XP_050382862.1 cyclin-dependent protein kinase inhibitor SMR11 [Potentilla anserina]XP_050382864.1 cyclin-dependent protein kinase inhibitor SMR11 [Potentilla anserina]XP_050382865.1 cyclin-dependent protein kinase inhibitor SMR11 [Potentilla anserina]
MGSGGCTNDILEFKEQSPKPCENLDKAGELQKDAAEPQAVLGPITPEADRENGDSQLTFLKKPPVLTVKSNRDGDDPCGLSDDSSGSPRTPEDGVFDPFAPGPEKLAMAPLCKKYVSKSRSIIARQLSFDSPIQSSDDEISSNCVESLSDEEMFEAVYENLLEAIVSDLTLNVLGERARKDWDCGDDCITPPGTRLNGIAESCPGAPLRPVGKSRKIDLGLIRKLEF